MKIEIIYQIYPVSTFVDFVALDSNQTKLPNFNQMVA